LLWTFFNLLTLAEQTITVDSSDDNKYHNICEILGAEIAGIGESHRFDSK
jgi:hypothetical protein